MGLPVDRSVVSSLNEGLQLARCEVIAPTVPLVRLLVSLHLVPGRALAAFLPPWTPSSHREIVALRGLSTRLALASWSPQRDLLPRANRADLLDAGQEAANRPRRLEGRRVRQSWKEPLSAPRPRTDILVTDSPRSRTCIFLCSHCCVRTPDVRNVAQLIHSRVI